MSRGVERLGAVPSGGVESKRNDLGGAMILKECRVGAYVSPELISARLISGGVEYGRRDYLLNALRAIQQKGSDSIAHLCLPSRIAGAFGWEAPRYGGDSATISELREMIRSGEIFGRRELRNGQRSLAILIESLKEFDRLREESDER